MQGIKAGQPLGGATFQPVADQWDDLGAGRRLPTAIGREAALQRVDIEHPVAAKVEQVVRPGIGRQAEQAVDSVLHRRLPASCPFPGLARGGAAQ